MLRAGYLQHKDERGRISNLTLHSLCLASTLPGCKRARGMLGHGQLSEAYGSGMSCLCPLSSVFPMLVSSPVLSSPQGQEHQAGQPISRHNAAEWTTFGCGTPRQSPVSLKARGFADENACRSCISRKGVVCTGEVGGPLGQSNLQTRDCSESHCPGWNPDSGCGLRSRYFS